MSKDEPEDLDEPLTPTPVPEKVKSKLSKFRKIFIIAGSLLAIILAGTYFFFFVIKVPKSADINQTSIQTKEKQDIVSEKNTYLDMDPITVGLSSNGLKREYLKIDLTLKLASNEESNIVMDKLPIIKDSLITFLRTLRSTDFNSSSSTVYLKEEITKRINRIVAPITVKEVLFQEITVN